MACGLSPTHRTCQGIAEHGEFSPSLPGPQFVVPTDWCAIQSGKGAEKGSFFETLAGELSHTPMVKACRLAAECRVLKTVEFEVDTVHVG